MCDTNYYLENSMNTEGAQAHLKKIESERKADDHFKVIESKNLLYLGCSTNSLSQNQNTTCNLPPQQVQRTQYNKKHKSMQN